MEHEIGINEYPQRWLTSAQARRYVGIKSVKTWNKIFRPNLTVYKLPNASTRYDRLEIDAMILNGNNK